MRHTVDRRLSRSSIGGAIVDSKREDTESEAAKELALFDRKVHKACVEMVDAAKKELRDLDVPFFCNGFGETEQERQAQPELQSRMIAFLEAFVTGDDKT